MESNQESLGHARAEQLREMQKEQAENEAEGKLEAMLRNVLEDDARTRLANIKLVNKELYIKTVQGIIYLYKSGGINEKLNDSRLKDILAKLNVKKEINIRRK